MGLMQKTFLLISVFGTLAGLFSPGPENFSRTPLPPNTAVATVADIIEDPAPVANDAPGQLSIPSIKLKARVVPMGVNSKGELDVPSGSTKDVGWYKDGTVPGDTGS